MKKYTVKEVADFLGKHEETVKRWIRAGKLPNSYRNGDKEGWRIIESDLLQLNHVIPTNNSEKQQVDKENDSNETELVKLAYQAVTLTSPTGEILSILSGVGIKRTLEILLIMQQSATKVKNHADSTNDRSWLKENHQKRSNRPFELGKQAIDLLIKRGKPVTYSNAADISKEIDLEGKGIHPNTIRTNEQLYEYYKQHSITYKQKMNGQNKKTNYDVTVDEINFRKIKSNRNLKNVHRKYMKLSKKELVQLLISAEQYIAENDSKWLEKHFEMFK